MPLTARVNNVTTIIQASWWNDLMNLLTGVMKDQPLDIANSLTLVELQGPTSAPTAVPIAGSGNKGVGSYTYAYSWSNADGMETKLSATVVGVITSTSSSIINFNTTATPPSGANTGWSYKVYRSKVGTTTPLYYVGTASAGTTNWNDTVADTSLTGLPPDVATIGALVLRDDGNTVQGYLAADNTNQRLVLFGAGRVEFHNNNGSQAYIDQFGLNIVGGSSAGLNINTALGTAAYIKVGRGGLGIKRSDNTKIAEFKDGGNMQILGNQYQSSSGSVAFSTGATFDAFDVGEVWPHDKDYPGGTVVCISDSSDTLTLCTHAKCPYAQIISLTPGFLMGNPDPEKGLLPIALTGTVSVKASAPIVRKQFLVSDGEGCVRPLAPGEAGYAVGFALNASANGVVGCFVRPGYTVGV